MKKDTPAKLLDFIAVELKTIRDEPIKPSKKLRKLLILEQRITTRRANMPVLEKASI
ncbi:MAG: hypothetical protein JKY62_16890 [Desulfocapsa sp.]|nr:hypothetical protein [Desulfocapsa sp.]